MYKIFGRKCVFSTFQETVGATLNQAHKCTNNHVFALLLVFNHEELYARDKRSAITENCNGNVTSNDMTKIESQYEKTIKVSSPKTIVVWTISSITPEPCLKTS
jgi:putative heme iron utilization protein